jgi:hypothetical protein
MEDASGATKGEDWLKGALTNANQRTSRRPCPPSMKPRVWAWERIRRIGFRLRIKRARSFDLTR